mgnify:CR=1 FL=1
MRTPIIGISANYTSDDQIGLRTELGFAGQQWQLVADDYVHVVERAGGVPVILPIPKRLEHIDRFLECCDGLLISGGNDLDPQYYNESPRRGLGALEPRRDAFDIALAQTALFQTEMPILGICRGCQILNTITGGSLYQDIYEEIAVAGNYTLKGTPKWHPTQTVMIERNTRLFDIFQAEQLRINSFNHQTINEVGDGFRVTMTTSQDGLIEGIEREGDRVVLGVQWHPETMVEKHPLYQALFEYFVRSCR